MLTLLKEIQTAAVDADAPLANVLRKCAVLGAQLKNDDLRDWALQELNGYENESDVPDYRKVDVGLRGNIAGPLGSGFQNIPIPLMALPEAMRAGALTATFTQGVAAIEALLEGMSDTRIAPLPGDAVAAIDAQGVLNGSLYAAWRVVSRSGIIGVIDATRNRVLELCLRLEAEMLELATAQPKSPESTQSTAGQVFNQVIVFGRNSGDIANASPGATQTVQLGDLKGLTKALAAAGVPAADVDALKVVLEGDAVVGRKYGPKVADWYKRAKRAVASGVWSLSQGATNQTIRELIRAFFGD